MTLLPAVDTDEAFEAADPAFDYGPALSAIAESASLPAAAPTRFADGSVPVFGVGEAVIKLYPPSRLEGFANERAVLARLEGALPVRTPELLAAGQLEGWGYLVMGRLEGQSMRARFADMTEPNRVQVAEALGATLRALHTLSPDPLPGRDWPAWIAAQREGCVARHRAQGLDETWCAQIPAFLDEMVPQFQLGEPDVILHTEVMREHVFVKPEGDGFVFSGLLDFEPSWVGPPGYEAASVGLFFSEGDGTLWQGLLDGYGVARDELDEALARRSLAWALLHRYANLRWWLERLPARSARESLDDLAREWFFAPG